MRLVIAAFIALTILSVPALPAVYHVPDQFPTIQSAIDHSNVVNGDVVVVRPGTYVERIDFKGKALTVRSEKGPAATVIDGNQAGSVAVFQSGEGADAVLDGFRIVNGTGTPAGGGACHGGGIYCTDSSSPSIRNNVVAHNVAAGDGWGGGIYCRAGALPLLENNLVFQNQAGRGGGIASYGASPAVMNCTITENAALLDGGGVLAVAASAVTVENAIFWDNAAPSGKEACLGDASNPSTLAIRYSDVDGGKASVHVEAGSTLDWGAGMIEGNPLFVSPNAEDFRLEQHPCQVNVSNPCVDGGAPDAAMTKGATRTDAVQDEGVADMGYHYLEKYHDQDKPHWDNGVGFMLYFTDDNPANGFHDPGEAWFTEPNGPWQVDYSCWMASVSNLAAYEGYGNSYYEWIQYGGSVAPGYNTFTNHPEYPNGTGVAYTFDDGGWMELAIRHAGLAYQIILSQDPWMSAVWDLDPVAWCLERIAEGHPVSIAVFSSGDGRGGGPLKGYIPNSVSLSHAVTVWEIDTASEKIVITDSDDRIDGPRELTYVFKDNRWLVYNIYPDFREAHVMYATCLSDRITAAPQVILADQGGTVHFTLDAGSCHAGREYLLLASLAGTYPGIPLSGGAVLPLNWDFFTQLVALNINTPYFQAFLGVLDKGGRADAWFNAPRNALIPVVYQKLYFAYLLGGPADFASNALPVQIVK